MDKPVFDKSKLPSRHTTVGPARAPHRSYLYAMGLSADEIAQPLVGVASCWNEAAPCNIALMRQAQVVKKGVAAANGINSANGATSHAPDEPRVPGRLLDVLRDTDLAVDKLAFIRQHYKLDYYQGQRVAARLAEFEYELELQEALKL